MQREDTVAVTFDCRMVCEWSCPGIWTAPTPSTSSSPSNSSLKVKDNSMFLCWCFFFFFGSLCLPVFYVVGFSRCSRAFSFHTAAVLGEWWNQLADVGWVLLPHLHWHSVPPPSPASQRSDQRHPLQTMAALQQWWVDARTKERNWLKNK